MRPIFILHGGEFLVGEQIYRRFGSNFEVWIPAKDNGIDLLLTRRNQPGNPIRIQVKSSRSYGDEPWGWFTLKTDKLRGSTADVWIFVIPFYTKSMKLEPQFVLIPIEDLRRRIPKKCGKTWYLNLYIPSKRRCFDARGWTQKDYEKAANGHFDKRRDFSNFIENWRILESN